MSNPHENQDLGRSPIEGRLHRLLRKMGVLLPKTADDVAAAERLLSQEPVELPPELLDPDRVFNGKFTTSLPAAVPDAAGVDQSIVEGFSAAARNGSNISEDMEAKLTKDWDDAIDHDENKPR